MRVVLAHDWITGVNQDLRTLQSLATLFPESKIAMMYYDHRFLPADIAKHQIQTSFLQKLPGKAKYSYHLMPAYIKAVEKFEFTDIDLLLSNCRGFAKGARAPESVLKVCYLHQPMPFAWQSLDLHFPKTEINAIRYKFIAKLSNRFRRWDLESAGRVNLFITDSEFSARQINHLYGRLAKVIYPPVDTEYFIPGDQLKADYFLIVGPLNRNRRIENVIEAFKTVKEKLVIAGEGWDFYRLVNMAPPNVSFTGYVDEAGLRQLYRDCRALISISDNSFCIAAIEAAACGKPVISLGDNNQKDIIGEQITQNDSIIEVGEFGIFGNENSVSAIIKAIKLFNQTDFDSQKLRENSLRFSRQRFFDNTRDFLMEAYSLFRRDGHLKLERRLFG